MTGQTTLKQPEPEPSPRNKLNAFQQKQWDQDTDILSKIDEAILTGHCPAQGALGAHIMHSALHTIETNTYG